jgi:hypothetical protein
VRTPCKHGNIHKGPFTQVGLLSSVTPAKEFHWKQCFSQFLERGLLIKRSLFKQPPNCLTLPFNHDLPYPKSQPFLVGIPQITMVMPRLPDHCMMGQQPAVLISACITTVVSLYLLSTIMPKANLACSSHQNAEDACWGVFCITWSQDLFLLPRLSPKGRVKYKEVINP